MMCKSAAGVLMRIAAPHSPHKGLINLRSALQPGAGRSFDNEVFFIFSQVHPLRTAVGTADRQWLIANRQSIANRWRLMAKLFFIEC